ncbi:MAG TPA: mechanosensitive ion channel family protein [Candidatus Limnocylindria bacterium]|nr:mechanosensitive ion channel family protein [Candidatus Limnocylindria bacterium]
MRVRLQAATFVRAMMLGLTVWVVWSLSIRARAQSTNTVATNAPLRRLADGFTLFDDRLIEQHRSELSFGLDQVEALHYRVFGEPLWQYIASAIYLLLAFYAARFVDWFTKNRLTSWAEKTETKWDDVLVGLADGPVKVLVFVVLFHLGLQVFDWPAWLELWLSRLTFLLLAISMVMVAMRAVDAAIVIWKQSLKAEGDRGFDEQFLVLIGKLCKITILLVAFLMLLDNLHVNITALLGSVSVLGLALGLAAQDTVSNLFGAIAVFVDKPFKVGDVIKVGDIQGNVEEMGLRAARVRTVDGFLVTVPNKTIGANTVINISRRGSIRLNTTIGLTYDTSVERVKKAIELVKTAFSAHALTSDISVTFNQFADSSLNLDIVWLCKTTDFNVYKQALQEINLLIKERFDAEKLDFAFPSRTVYHKHDVDPSSLPISAQVATSSEAS